VLLHPITADIPARFPCDCSSISSRCWQALRVRSASCGHWHLHVGAQGIMSCMATSALPLIQLGCMAAWTRGFWAPAPARVGGAGQGPVSQRRTSPARCPRSRHASQSAAQSDERHLSRACNQLQLYQNQAYCRCTIQTCKPWSSSRVYYVHFYYSWLLLLGMVCLHAFVLGVILCSALSVCSTRACIHQPGRISALNLLFL
jgi:hypothetical protein